MHSPERQSKDCTQLKSCLFIINLTSNVFFMFATD